jgi:hypothetical protein
MEEPTTKELFWSWWVAAPPCAQKKYAKVREKREKGLPTDSDTVPVGL